MTNYVTRITIPHPTTNEQLQYYVKDEEARTLIEELTQKMSNATRYIGKTVYDNIYDGATVSAVQLEGKTDEGDIPVEPGDIVIVGKSGTNKQAPKEFIWNGTSWSEFGSTGSLGKLAFMENGYINDTVPSAIYWPNEEKNFSGSPGEAIATYTPEGSITVPTFTGTKDTITVSGSITGEVNIATTSGQTYTPAGSIEWPVDDSEIVYPVQNIKNFKGETTTASITTIIGSAYTPEGNIYAEGTHLSPEITVELNTDTVKNITSFGNYPSINYSITGADNKTLKINWVSGTAPSWEDKSIATTVKTASIDKMVFLGKSVGFSASFTPKGKVAIPNFVGTDADLKGVIKEGQTNTLSGSFTPSGTIGGQTFNGTTATIVSSYTPEGEVDTPKFSTTTIKAYVQEDISEGGE